MDRVRLRWFIRSIISIDGGFIVLNSETSSPFNWNTSTVADGAGYDIKVSSGGPNDIVTVTINNTVVVPDTTPPVLTLPSNIIEEAVNASGKTVVYVASANDTVSGVVPVTCNPASGSTFAIGNTTVDCTATDNANNTAAGSFNVEVRDTTAPAFGEPSDITVEATSADGAVVNFTLVVTDAVDAAPVVVCDPASGSTFALGDTGVTCTATDSSGNQATLGTGGEEPSPGFTVTVEDTTAPVITLLGVNPFSIEIGSAYSDPGATALDIVDGDLSSSVVVDESGVNTAQVGSYVVNYTVTDEAGNTGTAQRTVNVLVDATAPVITILGSNPIALIVGGAYADEGATAFDNQAGNVTSCIQTVNNVNTSVAGSYNVTYTVTDEPCGEIIVEGIGSYNTATAVRIVNVNAPAPSGGNGGGGGGGGRQTFSDPVPQITTTSNPAPARTTTLGARPVSAPVPGTTTGDDDLPAGNGGTIITETAPDVPIATGLGVFGGLTLREFSLKWGWLIVILVAALFIGGRHVGKRNGWL